MAVSAWNVGDRIAARFIVRERLGAGVLCERVLATDDVSGFEVLLRVVHPQLLADAAARAAFRARMSLARGLAHPNLVRLLDVVQHEEREVVALSHAAGRTLADLVIRDGEQRWEAARRLLGQVAEGLLAAHARGVVLGDLRPSTVVLSPSGEVQVLSVGAALALPRAAYLAAVAHDPGHAHLAPELLAGRDCDRRADVFGLAGLALVLLSGTDLESARAGLRPELPPAIVLELERSLDDDPARRAATIDALMAGLDRAAESHAGAAAAARPAHAATAGAAPIPAGAGAAATPMGGSLEEETDFSSLFDAEEVAAPASRAGPPEERAIPREEAVTGVGGAVALAAGAAQIADRSDTALDGGAAQADGGGRASQPEGGGSEASVAASVEGAVADGRPSVRAPAGPAGWESRPAPPEEPAIAARSRRSGRHAPLLAGVVGLSAAGALAAGVMIPRALAPGPLPVTAAPEASIPAPSIPAPSIPAPSIPAPSIPAPSIPAPSIPAPSIPAPSIPAPSIPSPSIPAPSIPALAPPRADPPAPPATNAPSAVAAPEQMVLVRAHSGSFRIDAYEYPGKGLMPRVDVSLDEAGALCAARGARLCTRMEFEVACRGEGWASFPYGTDYDPAQCNTEEGPVAAAGAFVRCRSHAGAFDMSGNVAEWTRKGGLKGGAAGAGKHGARCSSELVGDGKPGPRIGFRCCRDGPEATP